MDPSRDEGYPSIGPEVADDGWRWWAKVASIVAGAVLAALLIVFGAARFLDQADEQHNRVECIRMGVQRQATGNAVMASAVLDPRLSVEQRRAAVTTWSDEQVRVATQLGRC